jgi:protein TonB
MGNSNSARMPPGGDNNSEINFDLDDAMTTGSEGASAQHPPILALSRDAALLETIRKAIPRGTRYADAPGLDQAAEKLPVLQPGVLVVDTASVADVQGMVAQLTQNFPELVVVVAGKTEDSTMLKRLTAAGEIYRFLLKPISHGQTRLTLEAAITRHQELGAAAVRLSTSSDSGAARKNYLPTYAGIAAAIVAVLGGIWFVVSRMAGDEHSAQNGAPGAAAPARQDPVSQEIALADKAFDEGKYVEPAGASALDLYRSALNLDPNSAKAQEGIKSIADKVLEKAEAALTAEHLEEAVTSLELARDIKADHPRLAFLDSQIARERERLKLSQAQEVGTKVRALLAQATQRVEQDRLVTPQGESARDALLEARRLDPTDPNIAQAFRDLGGRVAESARQAANSGQMDQAQSYLVAARQLGYAGSALAAVERTVSEARNSANKRATVDAMVNTIRKRLADGQLIDPAGDSARDLIANVRSSDPSRPDLDDLSKQLSTKLIDAGKQAATAQQFDRAQTFLTAARDAGVRNNDAALSQAERDLDQRRQAQQQAAAAQAKPAPAPVVAASAAIALKRTKTVAPSFPESARKAGLSGWVEVSFTVTPKGEVTDVNVRNSSPENVFDDAAVKAVKQWRFEPPTHDGQATSQRSMVRLKFDNPGG